MLHYKIVIDDASVILIDSTVVVDAVFVDIDVSIVIDSSIHSEMVCI